MYYSDSNWFHEDFELPPFEMLFSVASGTSQLNDVERLFTDILDTSTPTHACRSICSSPFLEHSILFDITSSDASAPPSSDFPQTPSTDWESSISLAASPWCTTRSISPELNQSIHNATAAELRVCSDNTSVVNEYQREDTEFDSGNEGSDEDSDDDALSILEVKREPHSQAEVGLSRNRPPVLRSFKRKALTSTFSHATNSLDSKRQTNRPHLLSRSRMKEQEIHDESTTQRFSDSDQKKRAPPRNVQVKDPTYIRSLIDSGKWKTLLKCPVQSQGCRYMIKRPSDLERHLLSHIRMHTPSVFQCKGVPVEEASGYRLPRNPVVHTDVDGKQYVGGCFQTFSRLDPLIRHLRNTNCIRKGQKISKRK